MDKNICVTGVMKHEITVSAKDAFEAIKKSLGFSESHGEFLCVRDGKLMRGEDVSYHGSPYYEYTLVSDNSNWVKLYESVKQIDVYFKNSDTVEWEKVIESQSNEQSEENADLQFGSM